MVAMVEPRSDAHPPGERRETFDCVPCGFHAEIARKEANANLAIFPCPRCGRRRRAGLTFASITAIWCSAIAAAAFVLVMQFDVSALLASLLGSVALVLCAAIVVRRQKQWSAARRSIVFYSS